MTLIADITFAGILISERFCTAYTVLYCLSIEFMLKVSKKLTVSFFFPYCVPTWFKIYMINTPASYVTYDSLYRCCLYCVLYMSLWVPHSDQDIVTI